LETPGFREPYQMGAVQRFGEKRRLRRILGHLRKSGVESSKSKWPQPLGSNDNDITWRTRDRGQAGGARQIRTRNTNLLHALRCRARVKAESAAFRSELTGFPAQTERCCGDLERLRRASGAALPGTCLGGAEVVRRMAPHKPRGFYDQAQIKAEGRDPPNRPKNH
jgi:hypothetical protein